VSAPKCPAIPRPSGGRKTLNPQAALQAIASINKDKKSNIVCWAFKN
jgi:hypothetical protein